MGGLGLTLARRSSTGNGRQVSARGLQTFSSIGDTQRWVLQNQTLSSQSNNHGPVWRTGSSIAQVAQA